MLFSIKHTFGRFEHIKDVKNDHFGADENPAYREQHYHGSSFVTFSFKSYTHNSWRQLISSLTLTQLKLLKLRSHGRNWLVDDLDCGS